MIKKRLDHGVQRDLGSWKSHLVPGFEMEAILGPNGSSAQIPAGPILLPLSVRSYYHTFVMDNLQAGTGPLWVFFRSERKLSLVASTFIGEVTQPWPLVRMFS